MAAQEIIDLDAGQSDTVGVRIDGTVYELPGDIPVPEFLYIARLVDSLGKDTASGPETLEELYERVFDLFRVHQPDLEDLPIGPSRLGKLVMELYQRLSDIGGAQSKPGRPPKPPARRGGTSKSRAKSRPGDSK